VTLRLRRSDDGTPSVPIRRTEPAVLPDDGFDGIGIVRGDEGVDEPVKVEDEAHLLLRPVWVHVCPVERVRRAPDPNPPAQGVDVDPPDRADGVVGDALRAPPKVD
jgi:hypothetical protein